MELWDGIKIVGNWIIIALIGIMGYFGKTVMARIDDLEVSSTDQDKEIAVIKSRMKDIESDIKEIKEGINKLIDRLCRN